ncbi:MAG: prepilin-type N-terminal cleavage/methylation domain-containing protein [Pseudomonadota bacterium]
MRISRARRRPRGEAGFSIIEMTVAVAVVGLLGTAVLLGTRPSDTLQLRNTAGRLALFIEETQLDAARRGHGIALRYSPAAHAFHAGPRVFALPEAVTVDRGNATPLAVDMRPSGESGGALIRLVQGEAATTLKLDWLTGAVRLKE